MPIGLLLCFGPAMLVWWLTEAQEKPPEKPRKRD
jgi:hypothetical protein